MEYYCFGACGIVPVVISIVISKGSEPVMWDLTRAAKTPNFTSFAIYLLEIVTGFCQLFGSPLVTHCTHVHTKKKKKTTKRLFVCKIKITRFIYVQSNTINIPETQGLDSTSTRKSMFHYNSSFFRFVWCISLFLLV